MFAPIAGARKGDPGGAPPRHTGIMTESILGAAALVGFAPTTDLDRATRFYRDTLGLVLVFDTPDFAVFDSGDRKLRVTRVERFDPFPFTVLGWQVVDIAAAVTGLRAESVDFLDVDGIDQDELGIWTTPGGDQVAWFHDPDGNVLSLQQPPPA
jgi:catechol 2,3-dioxygenase-like lactoylglutathione lyase family enzyme